MAYYPKKPRLTPAKGTKKYTAFHFFYLKGSEYFGYS